MDTSKAKIIGLAFALGVRYAKRKTKRKTLTFDEAKWITVKPNGPQHTGRPALIDSVTGQVLGGMGGKFNGRHISAVKNKGKNEQPGAQMQIIARDPAQKAAAMNNQRIDFKVVGGTQSQAQTSPANTKEAKRQEQSAEQERRSTNKAKQSENNQPAENNQQSITNADFKKYHMPLNQLSKIEKETDKAFLISSDFASGFDGDDTVFKRQSVWVPKSQVSSKNGYVFGMNPKWAKENGFITQRSRELTKRLHLPSLENQSKESVSASSVLGIPNTSSWNRKIYTYKNGEKAVFINNKKVILNDEQYNKLKSLT